MAPRRRRPEPKAALSPDVARRGALAVVHRQGYIVRMDTVPRPDNDTSRPETAAEQQRRLAWEAEMIAEADAEIEAGLFVEEVEVDAWIDSLGTDHELPVPQPRPPPR